MAFAAGVGLALFAFAGRAFGLLKGDTVFLSALQFLEVPEELAREAGFVAAGDIKGVGLLDQGSGLNDHDSTSGL